MYLFIMTLLIAIPLFASDLATPSSASERLPYPIASCLTCGDMLGENTVTLFHSSRELKFCCIECVGSYTKSPETYISGLEEQIRVTQRDNYPLKACVVSGHELGSMGDPVEYVSGNTLVKFCCGACIGSFERDRVQMINKIESARSNVNVSIEKKDH